MRKVVLYRLALVAVSLAVVACASLDDGMGAQPAAVASAPVYEGGAAGRLEAVTSEPQYEGNGVPLDEALSTIAAYYIESLAANTKIALINFESEARLLSDYILEELWIQFEDRSSFVMVDRQHLELIQQEIIYEQSGVVSDESMQSITKQFGAQTLVHGKITPFGREYRLIVNVTNVEQAITSMRRETVILDSRFTEMLAKPSTGGAADMASALYSGKGNPWRFTVQTDKSSGNYRDGDYMTLRVYSERDAYFKITHIDVNGNAQVIYPVSPRDNAFIKAGETRQIPDNTRFRLTKPYGEETILVSAYEKPFVVRANEAAPLSNQLLLRGLVVETEDVSDLFHGAYAN
ncbi:hypothetical protein FACS1894200_09390 [Spirochaetia bacterium]|nr:hypothetical protein FACS1894200_09390 [Spirochaetia bacterium]